jgi:hypothetical protein
MGSPFTLRICEKVEGGQPTAEMVSETVFKPGAIQDTVWGPLVLGVSPWQPSQFQLKVVAPLPVKVSVAV